MRLAKILNPRSIRVQLMASYLTVLLLTAGATALAFLILFDWRGEDASALKGLKLQAKWIEQSLVFDATGRPLRLDPHGEFSWIYDSIGKDLQYALLDRDGRMLFGSMSAPRPLAHPGQAATSRATIGGIPFVVMTKPLAGKDGTWYLQVAHSERLSTLTRRSVGKPVLATAIWVSVVSLLLLLAVVHLTLRRFLRPLQIASRAAAGIEPTNLSKRLDTRGLPIELAPLVEAFNKALDRLERGFKVQPEFLAGAAHELKTPLALIRAQIELDGMSDPAALLKDVDLMARQVHQLLHLAEVSEAHNYVFAPTGIPAVASEVIGYLGRLADLRQVSLRLGAAMSEGRLVDADRSAIFILLKNLVENAVRHASAGGAVLVAIDDGGFYVQDDGAGIAPDDLPKLYQRFWRGAGRRDDGAGLGLAICHQIAAVHGWTIEARNVAPGARFTVRFSQDAAIGKSPVMELAA